MVSSFKKGQSKIRSFNWHHYVINGRNGIQCSDVNNLWAMSHKLPVNTFEWIKDSFQIHEDSIKNYNEESDEEYFLQFDIQYLEKLHELHNGVPLLPEWMKIEKAEKLVANLHDKIEYLTHIRNLKQASNHGLSFNKSS